MAVGGIAVDLPRSPAGPSPQPCWTFPKSSCHLPQTHPPPSPQSCQTFPTESIPGATQSYFFWGRSTILLGKVFFSPRGPSPSLRPLTALGAISGGEGHGERQVRTLLLDGLPPYCHFDIFGFQPCDSDKLRDGSIHSPEQVGGNAHFLVFGQFRQICFEP